MSIFKLDGVEGTLETGRLPSGDMTVRGPAVFVKYDWRVADVDAKLVQDGMCAAGATNVLMEYQGLKGVSRVSGEGLSLEAALAMLRTLSTPTLPSGESACCQVSRSPDVLNQGGHLLLNENGHPVWWGYSPDEQGLLAPPAWLIEVAAAERLAIESAQQAVAA